MTTARDRAQRRRQLAADAETAYDSFLSTVATPLVKQIANALQAEGYAFTLSTPGRGLRLALDRGRDDFIELALETDADEPTVIGRIRRTRGSRTIEEERPVKRGASPDQVSEQDLLDFFANALEPWLGR
jgi:ribosomal protein S8